MAIPTDNAVPLTGNTLIDGLVQGSAWRFDGGPRVITYSLSVNDTPSGGTWTWSLSDAARRAFQAWEAVANVSFLEVDSGTVYSASTADIAVILTGDELQSQDGSAGFAGIGIFPSPAFADNLLALGAGSRAEYPRLEGDVALDNYYPAYNYLYEGGQGFTFMLHEIGHALGLKHPNDDGNNGRPTFNSLNIGGYDNTDYTVMSYARADGKTDDPARWGGNPSTPMPLDILAIQEIYGANANCHGDDDRYSLAARTKQWTIWDTGGNDTIDIDWASYLRGPATLDLREGHKSTSREYSFWIAYGVTIENAIGGSNNDTLIGNAAANTLDGATGDDTMTGGAANDTYLVDAAGDLVIEQSGEGRDRIVSAVAYTLPDNVEDLTLSGGASVAGIGNDLANVLIGNGAPNELTGGAGSDTLDGGIGLDSMRGGTGNDVYVVEDSSCGRINTLCLYSPRGGLRDGFAAALDLTRPEPSPNPTPYFSLEDRTGDGLIDYIWVYFYGTSVFSLTIGANGLGENLRETAYQDAERAFVAAGHPGLDFGCDGSGYETDGASFTVEALDIDYSGGKPVLRNLAVAFQFAPNVVDGSIALGSFNYNHVGMGRTPELITERPDEGVDEVRASVSFALPDNVENLRLTGNAAIQGVGNGLANRIFGNAADNALAGGAGADRLSGGSGADTLTGGSGNDLFVYASALDSTVSACDVIADFHTGDLLSFAGMRGLALPTENRAYDMSVAAAVATIRGDSALANAIVCFSDGATEYVYVNGAGSGVSFDGTLIALAGVATAPGAASFEFPAAAGSVTVYHWKNHQLIADVDLGDGYSTRGDGTCLLQASGSFFEATPIRPVANGEAEAVNLADAIAILRLLVGLEINGSAAHPLSPYQAIAADYDGSGAVSLADAVGVLRHAVGLPGSGPEWVFADETDTQIPAQAGDAAGAVASSVAIDLTARTGLVGILRGDVDGNWNGGGAALPDGYFNELIAAGFSASQWGIYPT